MPPLTATRYPVTNEDYSQFLQVAEQSEHIIIIIIGRNFKYFFPNRRLGGGQLTSTTGCGTGAGRTPTPRVTAGSPSPGSGEWHLTLSRVLLTAQCAGRGDILPLPRHADPDPLGVAVDSPGEGDGGNLGADAPCAGPHQPDVPLGRLPGPRAGARLLLGPRDAAPGRRGRAPGRRQLVRGGGPGGQRVHLDQVTTCLPTVPIYIY